MGSKDFNKAIGQMRAGGLIYHFAHDPLQLEITMDYSAFAVDDSEEKLTMEIFIVLFIFLLVGMPIALIALFVEKYSYKKLEGLN